MKQEKLNKIISAHKEWLETDSKKGACVDLRRADLRWADLREADLRWANFRWADLRGANLSWADLRRADLCGVDLCGADLRGATLENADLCGADLRGANLSEARIIGATLENANLRGAKLPIGLYTAGGAGSEQRYTYYDAINDRIICGCWNDGAGNHLDSFKKRIEGIYGPDGEESNSAHYKAYRAVIQYFEACREAYDL